MASSEIELINTYLPWVLGIITIIASLYAGIKFLTRWLVCRGKNQADKENWKNLIEGKIKELVDDIENFKTWAKGEHEEMNENVEKKFAQITDTLIELKEAQAKTNGYLERLAEEKTT